MTTVGRYRLAKGGDIIGVGKGRESLRTKEKI